MCGVLPTRLDALRATSSLGGELTRRPLWFYLEVLEGLTLLPSVWRARLLFVRGQQVLGSPTLPSLLLRDNNRTELPSILAESGWLEVCVGLRSIFQCR